MLFYIFSPAGNICWTVCDGGRYSQL